MTTSQPRGPRIYYTPEFRDKLDRILDNQDKQADKQTKLEVAFSALATKLESIERRLGIVEDAPSKRSESAWSRWGIALMGFGVVASLVLGIVGLVR